MHFRHLIVLGLVITAIVFHACQKDTTFTGINPSISVSTDTLTFDTVFTEVGSATRSFKIYNNESEDIEIDLKVNTLSESKFRLNVDGIPGNEIKDVFIKGNDSIYVFADVTVDPNQPVGISPFVIEESITISGGGSEKDVILEAWGQNANYVPGTKSKGVISLLSCDLGMETWDDPKPYVIYGVLFIDSCELVIPEGTNIYVHGGLVRQDSLIYNDGFIIVLADGKITAQGTAMNPITFQGDRLESSFDDVAGQWVGMRFISGSVGNHMEHVKLKNSVVGVRVDSAAQLSLESCEIYNTSSAGIIGIRSEIDVKNTLIHSNGQSCAILTYGGDYNFEHCTFSSYGNQSSAVRFDNFRCTDPPLCQEIVYVNRLDTKFTNCIFAGSDKDEILPIDWTGGADPDLFNFDFVNCAVTIDEILLPEQYPNFFDNCSDCFRISVNDTLFFDADNNEYRLDTMSIAIDKGIQLFEINQDINDDSRDGMPDVGAFEFQK